LLSISALSTVVPIIWLTLTAHRDFLGKTAFVGTLIPLILGLALVERHFSKSDRTSKMFLPETLFAIQAKII
jgi:hypothetical protein